MVDHQTGRVFRLPLTCYLIDGCQPGEAVDPGNDLGDLVLRSLAAW